MTKEVLPAKTRRKITPQPLAAAQLADALLKLQTVQAIVGYSKTKIYCLVARHEFPQPIRRGNRCTRWKSAEVIEWIQAQGK